MGYLTGRLDAVGRLLEWVICQVGWMLLGDCWSGLFDR